jgi:hypothetical protein
MSQKRGICWRLIHQGPAEIDAQIEQIAAMGCSEVAVVFSHYMRVEYNPSTGDNEIAFAPKEQAILNSAGTPWLIFPDLGPPEGLYSNTPSPDLVYYAMSRIKAAGMNPVAKPHIDLLRVDGGRWQPTGWRGYAVLPRRLMHDFIWSYCYRFLAPYVSIAAELGAGLVFGTELYSISKSYGADLWMRIVELVRNKMGYKGLLTYSANGLPWGDGAEWKILGDLWTVCDYIGMSNYVPMAAPGDPTDDAALAAAWHRKPFEWHPPVDDWMTVFAGRLGKQIIWTEYGLPNSTRAPYDPMSDPQAGDVQDDELQARLVRATLDHWADKPELHSLFWWEADRGDRSPISHQVHPGTELAEILFGEAP